VGKRESEMGTLDEMDMEGDVQGARWTMRESDRERDGQKVRYMRVTVTPRPSAVRETERED